jgi:hypothetical protein
MAVELLETDPAAPLRGAQVEVEVEGVPATVPEVREVQVMVPQVAQQLEGLLVDLVPLS